jgi:hypothetical protein
MAFLSWCLAPSLWAAPPADPGQNLERTCFQTGGACRDTTNLRSVALAPGTRHFLLDLDRLPPAAGPRVLASACKVYSPAAGATQFDCQLEGIANTPAIALLQVKAKPLSATLEDRPLDLSRYDPAAGLLWLSFTNEARLRSLVVKF